MRYKNEELKKAVVDVMSHFNKSLKHPGAVRPSSEQLIVDFYKIMDKHAIDLNEFPSDDSI